MTSVKRKLIVIESGGSITELGGISGPVINPFWADLDVINIMVAKHRKVFEVNPANRSERIRLVMKNIRTKNFEDAPTVSVAHVAPATPKAVAHVDTTEPSETTPEEAEKKASMADDFTIN